MMIKLTRLLAMTVVFAVVMIFMTAASFAGTNNKTEIVRYVCSSPDELIACYDDLVVRSDLAEKYFYDYNFIDEDGEYVTYLDVVIAAIIRKYGKANVRKYLKLSEHSGDAWFDKAFEQDVFGCIVNDFAIKTNHHKVKDGATVITMLYTDYDWYKLYSVFDKSNYTVVVGDQLTVYVKGIPVMGSGSYIPSTAKLSLIDIKACKKIDFEGAAFNNGSFTISFTKTGTYFITADGKTSYSISGSVYEDKDTYGGLAKIVVKDIVPGKPVIKTAKRNSKTKGTVKWSKAKNAKKYEVAYRIKGNAKWSARKTSSTSITLKLKAKKAYQVKVRSINGTSMSAYSAVKTIKAK